MIRQAGHWPSVVSIFCLLLTPAAVSAQTTGIAGVVKDATGAVLPGVTIEASSPALIEKVRATSTDEAGLYRIVDLRPGNYAVKFTLQGFAPVMREGIEVTTSFTATVNAEMKIGDVKETITVSGKAPAVDVHNVVQRKVLSTELIEALPLARSVQTMAQSVPGVFATSTHRPSGQDVGGLSGERGQLLIHGSRAIDMALQFDGRGSAKVS